MQTIKGDLTCKFYSVLAVGKYYSQKEEKGVVTARMGWGEMNGL